MSVESFLFKFTKVLEVHKLLAIVHGHWYAQGLKTQMKMWKWFIKMATLFLNENGQHVFKWMKWSVALMNILQYVYCHLAFLYLYFYFCWLSLIYCLICMTINDNFKVSFFVYFLFYLKQASDPELKLVFHYMSAADSGISPIWTDFNCRFLISCP